MCILKKVFKKSLKLLTQSSTLSGPSHPGVCINAVWYGACMLSHFSRV